MFLRGCSIKGGKKFVLWKWTWVRTPLGQLPLLASICRMIRFFGRWEEWISQREIQSTFEIPTPPFSSL